MALTRLLAAAAAAGLAAAQTSYAPATTSRLLAGAGEDTVLDTVFDGKLMIIVAKCWPGVEFRVGFLSACFPDLSIPQGGVWTAPCSVLRGLLQCQSRPRERRSPPGRRAKKSDLERLRQPPGPGGTGAASAAFNDRDATQDAVARGTAAAASRRNFAIWPRRRRRAGPRRSRREGFRYIDFHLHSR